MLYNILIIKYISCFDLNVLSVNLRNRFERILIDVVQMLSKCCPNVVQVLRKIHTFVEVKMKEYDHKI